MPIRLLYRPYAYLAPFSNNQQRSIARIQIDDIKQCDLFKLWDYRYLFASYAVGAATGVQSTFLVMVKGSVKFDKNDLKMFAQTFLLTAVSGTWKIVSDCYRTLK